MYSKPIIHTLDLNFQGLHGTIAAYLIPHSAGAALIECGPGSTIPALQAGLNDYHLEVKDITHVFLTHIHLDHAGAAGWLARQGANIYVHPVGAPHLVNPEKLLASATRLYGDLMDQLWGEFLPVPEDKLVVLEDGDTVNIDSYHLRAIETPGHASHHLAYVLGSTCFSGDIGGVRLAGNQSIRLPTPPPEFQPELWRESIKRLQKENCAQIAPTHFGIFTDADSHFKVLLRGLERIESWMETVMPDNLPLDELRKAFTTWEQEDGLGQGLSENTLRDYETANPSFMSADGILRYWNKYHNKT